MDAEGEGRRADARKGASQQAELAARAEGGVIADGFDAELDELRGGIRERIRMQRADLLKRVQGVLAPVVEDVKNQLQSSPGELSNRLRDVVETVVRPLSHDIGRGSKVDDEVNIISKRAKR